MGKIIPFTGLTKLDKPIDQILDRARNAGLDGVIMIGWDADGGFFAASTYADGGEVLWLLEQCKRKLLDGADKLSE